MEVVSFARELKSRLSRPFQCFLLVNQTILCRLAVRGGKKVTLRRGMILTVVGAPTDDVKDLIVEYHGPVVENDSEGLRIYKNYSLIILIARNEAAVSGAPFLLISEDQVSEPSEHLYAFLC